MKYSLPLIAIFMLFTSCSEESIDPSYAPVTLKEQLRNESGSDAFELSFAIEELEVDEFGGEIGDVPVVGSVFQRLAGMFADISIDDENGTEVVIEPTYFEFPELAGVDFDIIKKVKLEKVHLRVANDDVDGASLSFIKRIEVYLNVDPELPEDESGSGTDTDEGLVVKNITDHEIINIKSSKPFTVGLIDGQADETTQSEDTFRDSILLLTYDKDRDTIGCLSKCLDMRVQDVDWRKILMRARSFSIETKLVVDSVPKARIELGGEIKLSILLDLGF